MPQQVVLDEVAELVGEINLSRARKQAVPINDGLCPFHSRI